LGLKIGDTTYHIPLPSTLTESYMMAVLLHTHPVMGTDIYNSCNISKMSMPSIYSTLTDKHMMAMLLLTHAVMATGIYHSCNISKISLPSIYSTLTESYMMVVLLLTHPVHSSLLLPVIAPLKL
jgi:hypothetical protein